MGSNVSIKGTLRLRAKGKYIRVTFRAKAVLCYNVCFSSKLQLKYYTNNYEWIFVTGCVSVFCTAHYQEKGQVRSPINICILSTMLLYAIGH